MNGRIYDGLLGRFLSADLMVSNPSSLQSFNRYTYVGNNPLSSTDPSGFESEAEKNAREDAERQARNRAIERWISGGGAPVRNSGAAASAATSGGGRAQGGSAADTSRMDSATPSANLENTVKPDESPAQEANKKDTTARKHTEPSRERKKADLNLHMKSIAYSAKGTDGKEMLFPNTANSWYDYGEQPHFPANYFVIFAHGDSKRLYSYAVGSYGTHVDPKDYDLGERTNMEKMQESGGIYRFDDIVREIDARGTHEDKQPIYVAACFGASPKDFENLCQRLATHYDVEVIGWTQRAQRDAKSIWGMMPYGFEWNGSSRGEGTLKSYWKSDDKE